MGEALAREDDLPDMSPAEFARWQKLIDVRTGMHVVANRKPFLQRVLLSRMQVCGFSDYNAYYLHVRDGVQAALEWTELVDRLTVHETRFFRHPESFDLVREHVLRRLQGHQGRRPTVQCWSVACSTGEEAWSLAMCLQDLQETGAKFYYGVTAMDISFPTLAQAREAVFATRRLEGVSPAQRAAYFEACGPEQLQVKAGLRSRVCFVQGNLNDAGSYPRQQFDVVFCQNVLIYFQNARRRELLDHLAEHVKPGGLLVLAPGEVLRWQHPLLTRVPNKHCLAYSHRGSGRVAE